MRPAVIAEAVRPPAQATADEIMRLRGRLSVAELPKEDMLEDYVGFSSTMASALSLFFPSFPRNSLISAFFCFLAVHSW